MRALCRPASTLGKVIAVLCLCAVIGYSVLYAIAPWLHAQAMRRLDPRMSLVSMPLPSNADVPLSDASIDCYGFAIPLPKTQVGRTARSKSQTMVYFQDRGVLMIDDAESTSGVLEIIAKIKDAGTLLGPSIAQSKFKLMEAALQATPEQVKFWRFRSAGNERSDLLLVVKSLVLVQSSLGVSGQITPIRQIAAGQLRGFEFGDPESAPYNARLDLFDEADRHLVLRIIGRREDGPVLTQAEINALVAGIRPVAGR